MLLSHLLSYVGDHGFGFRHADLIFCNLSQPLQAIKKLKMQAPQNSLPYSLFFIIQNYLPTRYSYNMKYATEKAKYGRGVNMKIPILHAEYPKNSIVKLIVKNCVRFDV